MSNSSFRSQFTRIKGVSDRRRLPRLGKIRLGLRVKNKIPSTKCRCGPNEGCFYCTHGVETTYFVVPEEVALVYGKNPVKLDVRFPMDDLDICFPQFYGWYGSSKGLKCSGDGERALRYNEDKKIMESRDCPCEKQDEGDCNRRAYLRVILPRVNMGGVYEISTSSINSIVDVNSGVDYTKALIKAVLGIELIALIPLTLERKLIEIHREGKKEKHYTLRLYPNITIEELNKLKGDHRLLAPPQYTLPAPLTENPEFDEGATIIEADEVGEPGDGESSSVPEAESAPLEVPYTPYIPLTEDITEEDARKTLEEMGMVEKPEEQKPSETPKKMTKEEEAKALNDMAKVIAMFPQKKSLQEWYQKNKGPFQKQYSDTVFWEITKLVNDKLKKLKS